MSEVTVREESPPLTPGALAIVIGFFLILLLAGVVIDREIGAGHQRAALEQLLAEGEAGATPRPVVGLPLIEDFERPDGPGLGARWEEVSGAWGIASGAAVVTSPDTERFRQIALLRVPSGDREVRTLVREPGEGSGIGFRYESVFELWMLVAEPSQGGWSVMRISELQSENVAFIPGPTAGAVELGIRSSDSGVILTVEGEELEVAGDPDIGGVALIAGRGTQPRWEEVEVR